jgi:predicted ATP-dependent endonuclease of OLD family
MILKVLLKNFKIFGETTIELEQGLNILVGGNEAGKSTLLEAIHLALTARSGRYPLFLTLTHHLLNKQASEEYLEGLRKGRYLQPPEILIELYFTESDETIALKGKNNVLGEDIPGIRLWIHFDQDYASEYNEFVRSKTNIQVVPIEYYKVEWLAFSGTPITRRGLKVSTSLVDASKIRLKSGADYYLQQIIRDSLTDAERVRLAIAYSDLKQELDTYEGVDNINNTLESRGSEITDKKLSLSMDISYKNAWESSLIPCLDDFPIDYVGGGEQSSLKILLALTRQIEDMHIILIEEPENHLSYLLLNRLIKKISDLCTGKQLILSCYAVTGC